MSYNKDIIVRKNISLFESVKEMDLIERKLLIIAEDGKFYGLISIGDIQRALINKIDLNELAIDYVRSDILYAKETDDLNKIKELMVKERIESMPIVDEDRNLVDVLEWNDVFSEPVPKSFAKLSFPVVIMAGGMGNRLKPLTNIIPKPLIPISNYTIIEEIMNRFLEAGCSNFYISVNYKSKLIIDFLSQLNNYNISFIKETMPLGTAGSLYLLRNKLNDTFFVSNCDILVDLDYAALYDYHKSQKNEVTVVSVLKGYSIPYGTLDTEEGGKLVGLKEKPEFMYQINSGLYLLEPNVLDYMAENEYLDITDLLIRMLDNGKRIGVFPVSDGSWNDMGNWDDYLRLIGRR